MHIILYALIQSRLHSYEKPNACNYIALYFVLRIWSMYRNALYNVGNKVRGLILAHTSGSAVRPNKIHMNVLCSDVGIIFLSMLDLELLRFLLIFY